VSVDLGRERPLRFSQLPKSTSSTKDLDRLPSRVVTLLFYVFSVLLAILYPIGAILNIIGLITGPRRGCFGALLVFFILIPLALVLAEANLGIAALSGSST